MRRLTTGIALAGSVATIGALAFASIAHGTSGLFDRTWGEDVDAANPPGPAFELCTVAADCETGIGDGHAYGGELDLPVSVATDAAGNVYVADPGHNRIQKYSSDGAFERAWGGDVVRIGPGNTGTGFEVCVPANGDVCKQGTIPPDAPGGVMDAAGVAVDPTGNVYVADAFNNRVQKFNSSGAFERAWGEDVVSAGPGNTGTGFEICVAANGDTCKTGGVNVPNLGGEMSNPRDVEVDSAGNVYVADTSYDRIQKFSSAGAFQRAWGQDVVSPGSPGDTGTGFEICVAANGDTCKAGLATAPALGGEMDAPWGIETDLDGDVYVADQNHHRLQRFTPLGAFEAAWGEDVTSAGPGDTGTGFELCLQVDGDTCKTGVTTAPALGGEMSSPTDITIDAANTLYLADAGHDRIQKFDDFFTFERAWGEDVASAGAGNTGTGYEVCIAATDTCKTGVDPAPALGGELSSPRGVAIGAAGRLLVADAGHHRIQRFNVGGGFERTWGKAVLDPPGPAFEICTVAANCQDGSSVPPAYGGELLQPASVAVSTSGETYVGGYGQNRIEKFSGSGAFERAWGEDVVSAGPGNTGTGFEICVAANGDTCKAGVVSGAALGGELSFFLEGIATDSTGSVYVVDQSHQRIQKFNSSGAFERAWGEDVVSAGPGNTGTGFEICVAANGDTCKTGVVSAAALGGELSSPTGVATDSAGNVYVADRNHLRIQKFSSTGVFERAWGRDVASAGPGDTGTGIEICVALNGDTCKIGTSTVPAPGGEVQGTSAVATDAAGSVYIADRTRYRIQKFSASGVFERAWGEDVAALGVGDTGTGFEICIASLGDVCKEGIRPAPARIGELDNPEGLGVDAAGHVYVSDEGHERIQRYSTSGTPERTWGKDVAFSGPGNTGTGFEICVPANLDGCQTGVTGDFGGEFNVLGDLAATAAGGLYVADRFNNRIQMFAADPVPPTTAAPPPAETATGLRAAALKKCKKKPKKKRKKCRKRARLLPL